MSGTRRSPAAARGSYEEGGATLPENTAHDLPTWSALPARPDAGFDELAARVAAQLQVPRALVVLVSKGGQVLPGAFGLPEPWASQRSMPLTHSMGLRVVTTGRPVVIRDARTDPQTGDSVVVRELGVVSYAGMPLVDVQGRPVGALAVSDARPRDWRAAELATLRRLADEAARRLQFQALELAEREALAAAERDDAGAHQAAEAARRALVQAEAAADRTRVVARLSSELLPVQTLPDVLRAVDRFLRSPLGAVTTVLGLAESDSSDVQLWTTTAGAPPSACPTARLRLADAHPLAVAARELRLVAVPTRVQAAADWPALPVSSGETTLAVPLVLGAHAAGALLVGWRQHRELDAPLRGVVTDLARHVGHAVDRVLLRDQRLRLAGATPPVPVSG